MNGTLFTLFIEQKKTGPPNVLGRQTPRVGESCLLADTPKQGRHHMGPTLSGSVVPLTAL